MKFDSRHWLLFFLFLSFRWGVEAQQASLSGRIIDQGNGEPLIGATVVLSLGEATVAGTSTDVDGRYRLDNLTPGRYTLEVRYVGYIPYRESGYLVGSGPATGRNFALIFDPDLTLNPVELVFIRNEPVVNPLKREVGLEAVRRLPATFYDPARLIALSPGVVQTNDQANHLSVRGNSPNRNLWRLQGLAIVNPNHTANAGTLNDQPTFSGGGVNALSAQLLDNSTFYAGGLPAAYGNATAGTFDMRLRPGNTEKRQHQVQAGFIGFDLSTEGPFAKGNPNSGSYLVNYRYSFTGLLADLGADFGGEEIRFQDLSLHLYQPVGKNGQLSAFGLTGKSSNEFTGKDEEIEEQKELFDIDFFSDLFIGGATYEHWIGPGKLSLGAAYSTTESERDQLLRSDGSAQFGSALEMTRLSGRLAYDYRSRKYFGFSAGVELLDEDAALRRSTSLRDSTSLFSSSYSSQVISPYAVIDQRFGPFGLSAGLRYSIYDRGEDSRILEPRITLNYYYLNTSVLSLQLERSSRIPVAGLLAAEPAALSGKDYVMPTRQVSLGWQNGFSNGDEVKINAYHQYTENDLVLLPRGGLDGYFSFNSLGVDGRLDVSRVSNSASRTYGLELSYQRPIAADNFYYSANVSVFKSQVNNQEGEWTDSRFARDFIGQLTAGKEWSGTNRKGKARSLGLNVALIVAGGERIAPINEQASRESGQRFETVFATSEGLTDQLPAYVRPDLRLYRRKYHGKTTTTLALDIQNVTGRTNVAYNYFDQVTDGVEDALQLSLIPVLSYRIEWR